MTIVERAELSARLNVEPLAQASVGSSRHGRSATDSEKIKSRRRRPEQGSAESPTQEITQGVDGQHRVDRLA